MHFKGSQVTHVIFDLDGLLVDREVYIEKAMFNVCRKYGKLFDWDMKAKIMGRSAKQSAEMVCRLSELPISAEQFSKEFQEEYPSLFPQTQIMPGVHRLLDHLQKHGIPMAIASSSHKKLFPLKMSNMEGKFTGYFKHMLFGSEDPRVKQSKPFPDVFLVFRQMFAVSNQESLPPTSSFLVFEDSVQGVIAGLRAGMQVVWIPDPRMDTQEMMKKEPELRPTMILSSMKDFKPKVFGLPPFDNLWMKNV